MKCSLCMAVMLLATIPATAADKANPNKLTPKEIADGWILLFDGETTFGWEMHGEARIQDGVLVLGGDKETTATATTEFGYCLLQFDALTDDAKGAKLTFNAYADRPFIHVAPLREKGWHQFHAQCVPNDISIWANGSKGFGIWGTFDGPTAVAFHVPARQKLVLRGIKLKPIRLEAIFNGKDLTGWKEFPGKKSKFSVTKEGWIHLQNGPGDLQTVGQWADFVLQLDCLSNGLHLNSGVFFRCRPGEYQQGYEAQIRNQFTAKPTQEYTLEEYDPKTHELKGKKKIKSTAVDYGTGGIYRRYPARREVAKDHEWFTMTIFAAGKHMTVWVNGFQVTDWIDNRPLADNARNGCRLEKGPISLQGHDRTTDLSFRNIRIAELPRPASK